MSALIPYLLKLSICLAVVYLFYQLVLRRLTFYTWNRWYLLLYSFLSFFLPFVNLSLVLEKNEWNGNGLVRLIPAVGDYKLMKVTTGAVTEQVDWKAVIIVAAIGIGMLVMLVRLGMQYVSLWCLRRSAQLLLDDKVKVYQVDQSIIPFSFGNAIYLNQHLHNEEELKEIIRHEFVHVKQRHSLDILWMELFCLLNWYNPFAWLMRKAIRQNLEFIADRQVLQNGFDRKQYQYLLLKVTGVHSFSLTSNFNFSSLKKRIAMMNKTKSARVHLMRFLFVLPLLVVVLVAFRNTVQQQKIKAATNIAATDTVPENTLKGNSYNIEVINGQKVTVTLKNGQIEKYNLANGEERKAFEKKYGKLPEPPQPPAIPGGLAAVEPEAPEALEAPQIEAPGVPAIAAEPFDCFNKKGYCITVADNMGECVVIVKDKNMKIIEAIKMSDWNENEKKYEEKYGEIPPPPPPPVPPAKAGSGKTVRPPVPPPPPKKTGAGVHIISDDEVSVAGGVNVAGTGGRGTAIAGGTNEVNASGAGVSINAVIADGEPAGELEILAEIKSSTTREQLDQIQKIMKDKGFVLNIRDVQFKSGKLTHIDGTIANNDGSSNWTFSATDFATVTLALYGGKKGSKNINIIVRDGKVSV